MNDVGVVVWEEKVERAMVVHEVDNVVGIASFQLKLPHALDVCELLTGMFIWIEMQGNEQEI